jgi:hypothetical protein
LTVRGGRGRERRGDELSATIERKLFVGKKLSLDKKIL